MKPKAKKTEVNISQVKSMAGEHRFNKAVISEIQSGTPRSEAQAVVARKLSGMK